MSELQTASIRSYPTGGTITVNDDITVATGKTLTISGTFQTNAGLSIGGTLTCNGSDVAGAGDIDGTSVTATGALTGASLNVSSGAIDGGTASFTSTKIGTNATAPSDGCAVVSNQLTVENDSSSDVSLTVNSGKVDASGSEVQCSSLTVGGVNYDATQFANFNATSVLKSFGKIDYNINSGGVSLAGGFQVTSVTISGATISVNWANSIGTDYTVLLSSTEDGDEPDGGSSDGYQKIWQVTNQSGTQLQATLINSNNANTAESLFFLILDV
mgnify:CR=1 FL=1